MSRATRAEWIKRVERWQDSGLTAKEFAAELDVTTSALTYWKLKLRRERGAVGAKDTPSRTSPTTKFLQLVPTSVHADTGAPLELILRGGVVVRVPRDFDEPTLTRVLAMLGGQ